MCVCTLLHHPPFCYVSGGLEEASVVILLQALLGLCDEGAGALQTLSTVRNLLSQLAQLHHLRHTRLQEMLLCCDTLIYGYHLINLRLEGTHHFLVTGELNFSISNENTDKHSNLILPGLLQCNHRFLRRMNS